MENKRKKILFVVGSMNQTSQMHQIATSILEHDCYFTQMFSDAYLAKWGMKFTNILDKTVMAGQFRKNSEQYLRDHYLKIDYAAKQNNYDLAVHCTDMMIPKRLKAIKSIWIQEGMIDPASWKTTVVKKLNLPGFITFDTSLNGASNICDVYCTASEGYKDHFESMGTDRSKLIVTGMPNYDNIHQFLNNDFPHRDFVMVATSDIRETFRKEDRIGFLEKCTKIANGRQLLFKPHPNEKMDRAIAEIKANTPANTLIFTGGNTNEMIANSVELITQYSTVVYVGMALGKPVHSFFNVDELKRLAPIQNAGTSAKNIANVCSDFLAFEGNKKNFAKQYNYQPIAYDQNNILVGNNIMRA